MSRAALFYEQAAPVRAERHAGWSVDMTAGYAFSRRVNAVPLTTVEFLRASREYPIVLAGDDESLFPHVVLGFKDRENLYIAVRCLDTDAEGIVANRMRRDELFFFDLSYELQVAAVTYGAKPEFGVPQSLFRIAGPLTGHSFAVAPDGRILVRTHAAAGNAQNFKMILNWADLLGQP